MLGPTQPEVCSIFFVKTQAENHCNLSRPCETSVFSVHELVFSGFNISASALTPDDEKIEDTQNASAPSNAGEVRSLLSLVNYWASSFISNFATISL